VRLLFISSFYLFAETRFGGSKRLYYFAREWAKKTDLTLINMDACVEWGGGARERGEFADFLMVPGSKETGWYDRYCLAPDDMRKTVERNRDRIRAFLRGREFDAVLLAFPWSLAFLATGLLDGLKAPVTYLEDDLSFERYRFDAEAASGPIKRAIKRLRIRQTLSYYRPLMARLSGFVGISRQEAGAMERHFPGLRQHLVQYGLPMEEYPQLPPPAAGMVLGFIGNYGHPPNMDALAWLARELIPAILARNPGARFILAGKGLPDWAAAEFAGRAEVELRENVPDLKAFYSDITIFINPIRTGRGMRTKLVEAAAFGRPILTTSLGAEGLEALEMTVADDATAMAEACARPWAGMDKAVRGNREYVKAHFSLDKVAEDFLAFLAGAQRKPAESVRK
jgi:glycosyltransferase involved in cell wall biosynthesis